MVKGNEQASEILRRRYYKTKRRYVVFAGSVLIQFIGVAMPSAMLGIVYVDMTREFRAEASQAALMLSLFRGIAFGGGVLGEMVIRRVGDFPCMIGGALGGSLTLLASAFAPNMVTIVVLIGVGTGCGCVLPTLLSYVYISRAFPPKTAPKYLTTMTLGAGIGFMVTPYITEVLLSHFGWRGTLMMASGMFLQLVLIGMVIQVNLPPPSELQKSRDFKWTDVVEILKNRSYLTYITTMLLFGLFGAVEIWFLPDFLVSNNYKIQDAALVLTLSGFANVSGRLIAGIFESCFSRTKILYHWTYIFMTQALGHAVFPTFVEFYPVLCGSSLIYGVSFGLIVSQSVPVVVQALPQRLNSIGIAMEFTVYGLSTVLGGFVCGVIRDVTGGFEGVFYVASFATIFCSCLCITLFIADKTCTRKTFRKDHINKISVISHL
uniref:Major facilitator superfamily (MFS) profile domain-containing protein n=1 Tax=Magallana gigas TaxID=29159 RepID=A0A8W8JS72_MAGGI|nr:monocarboxylate transporter 13-like [Crassostrea gigas]